LRGAGGGELTDGREVAGGRAPTPGRMAERIGEAAIGNVNFDVDGRRPVYWTFTRPPLVRRMSSSEIDHNPVGVAREAAAAGKSRARRNRDEAVIERELARLRSAWTSSRLVVRADIGALDRPAVGG